MHPTHKNNHTVGINSGSLWEALKCLSSCDVATLSRLICTSCHSISYCEYKYTQHASDTCPAFQRENIASMLLVCFCQTTLNWYFSKCSLTSSSVRLTLVSTSSAKGFFSLNIALEIMLFSTLCTPKINS